MNKALHICSIAFQCLVPFKTRQTDSKKRSGIGIPLQETRLESYATTFLLLFLLLASQLYAAPADDIYKKLENSYKGLSSWQANVSQTNYFKQINTSTTFTGMIYFKPGRLLVNYTKPYLQRMQIQEGVVTIYDSQSNTIFRTAMLPEFGKMNPVEILQHYWKISKVKITKTDKNNSYVNLIPEKDQLIRSMDAVIRSSDGIVQELSYNDFNGNKVSYKFTNIKRNQSISDALWKYKYPENAQVIER